jgi:hypothetical protein
MSKKNKKPEQPKQTLTEKLEEVLCDKPNETMTDYEAAEVLLDESLRLIGKAEFELFRCDEKDCEACQENKQAALRLKQNCELLMALTAVDNSVTFPSYIDIGSLDNLKSTLQHLAAKAFPELDPHPIVVI